MSEPTPMPAHDSPEWREIRNRALRRWVQNPDAERWLLDMWDACEVVDDIVDGDKEYTRSDVIRMALELAVDCPDNPFFQRHASALLPVVRLCINQWRDSVVLEDIGTEAALHFAYVLRSTGVFLTQTVVEITRGREAMQSVSVEIIQFFGAERYEDYAEKLRGTTAAPQKVA